MNSKKPLSSPYQGAGAVPGAGIKCIYVNMYILMYMYTLGTGTYRCIKHSRVPEELIPSPYTHSLEKE